MTLTSIKDHLLKSYNSIDKIVRFVYNISAKINVGGINMSITATELKMNLSKYLVLAQTEDVYITRNGKVVAKLTNPFQDRVDTAKSLFGILPQDMTLLEDAREERLNQI